MNRITRLNQIIAYVLLISHILTSCSSNKEIIPQQELNIVPQRQISQHQHTSSTSIAPPDLSHPSIRKSPLSQEYAVLRDNDNTKKAKEKVVKKTNHPLKYSSLIPQQSQALSLLPQAKRQRSNATPIVLDTIFTNRQNCHIQFNAHDLSLAHVEDIHGRKFQLPVYKVEHHLCVEDIITKGRLWQQSHISVTFPEKGSSKKGYVLIAYMGLRGGVSPVRVSEGGRFKNSDWNARTHFVEYYPASGNCSGDCWRGEVCHRKWWFSGDSREYDRAWLRANYSSLSEEELRASSQNINYEVSWISRITDVNYIEAYLSAAKSKKSSRLYQI